MFALTPYIAGTWGLSLDIRFAHSFASDHSYAEAASDVQQPLASHAPIDGLRVLSDLLATALQRERDLRKESGPEDDSHYWRKAIDDHGQNAHDGEPRDALIVALRDLATDALTEPSLIDDVFAVLETHPHLIFRRLTIYLLQVTANTTLQERRRAVLLDRDAFDDSGLHRELCHLQASAFGELTADERATILGWIQTGPLDGPAYTEGFDRWEGRPPTAVELSWRTDNWRHRHLQPLEQWLPAAERAELARLNAAYGPLEPPDFRSWVTTGFRAIELPFTSDNLRDMPTARLHELFETWQASGDGQAADPDGLAHAVAQAVVDSPEPWATRAADLAAAPRKYLHALLTAFASAAAMRRAFPLEPVLTLAEALLAEPPPATSNIATDDARLLICFDGHSSQAKFSRPARCGRGCGC